MTKNPSLFATDSPASSLYVDSAVNASGATRQSRTMGWIVTSAEPPGNRNPDLNDTLRDSSDPELTCKPTLALVWVYPRVDVTLLNRPLITLGRGNTCMVRLSCERASRMHAELRQRESTYVLSDLASTNGTWHNGQRLDKAMLSDNDVIRIGDQIAVVMSLDDASLVGSSLFDEPMPGVVVGPRSAATWARLQELASTSLPVVLEGPTGTGKEVYAKALHQLSRRPGAFVGLNCAALPEALAEAQLFGQARGAFTGALRTTEGLFEAAHRGTLLLDEVIDLPGALQAKLLRALEESAVTRVGETAPRSVDIRLIAATQLPLLNLVHAGRFRADLVARLAGGTILLSPLSERREEIVMLFVRMFGAAGGDPAKLSAGFCEALCLQDWPLNMRQLSQVAEHAALAKLDGRRLQHGDLELLVARVYGARVGSVRRSTIPPVAAAAPAAPRKARLSQYVRRTLGARRTAWFLRHEERVEQLLGELGRNGGIISHAAQSIGISRQQAGRLLAVYGIVEDARAQESSLNAEPPGAARASLSTPDSGVADDRNG